RAYRMRDHPGIIEQFKHFRRTINIKRRFPARWRPWLHHGRKRQALGGGGVGKTRDGDARPNGVHRRRHPCQVSVTKLTHSKRTAYAILAHHKRSPARRAEISGACWKRKSISPRDSRRFQRERS